jgi:calcineurin-like phosphoesterase family protein
LNQGPDRVQNGFCHGEDLVHTMPNRLFAIGDIHGCATALRTLIEGIGPQPQDTVVVLGDIIDWGPDSRECVRQVIDLSNRCRLVFVRGNHEEMLFAALESRSELRYWLKFGGEETLKSYGYRGRGELIDADHVRFLKANARDYYETGEFIFVHASYDPDKPMTHQTDSTLQWEHVQPDKMPPHIYLGEDSDRRAYSPDVGGDPGPRLPEAHRHQRMSWGMAIGLGSRLGHRYSGR